MRTIIGQQGRITNVVVYRVSFGRGVDIMLVGQHPRDYLLRSRRPPEKVDKRLGLLADLPSDSISIEEALNVIYETCPHLRKRIARLRS